MPYFYDDFLCDIVPAFSGILFRVPLSCYEGVPVFTDWHHLDVRLDSAD